MRKPSDIFQHHGLEFQQETGKKFQFLAYFDYMDTKFQQLLLTWKKPFLRDQDLIVIFQGSNSRRYDTIKYAIKKNVLIPVRRGLYILGPPYGKGTCDPFEIAQTLYGPSYISLESALSYYGWIPEAVYATTSVSPKRAKVFETPLGIFRYSHTPTANFFLNVQRIANNETHFLIAEPWKAVADMIYCKKDWKSINDLSSDLRIDIESLQQSDKNGLLYIASYYASAKVRNTLRSFAKELE